MTNDWSNIEVVSPPPAPTPTDWSNVETVAPPDKSLSGFGNNLMGSAINATSDIGNALQHPLNTISDLASLARGGMKNIGFMPITDSEPDQDVSRANAFGQNVSNKIAHPLDTLYNDPVGSALDISTALGLTGGLLGGASKLTGISGLGDAARYASMAAGATDPLAIATQIPKSLLGLLPESFSNRLYLSGLKPGKMSFAEQQALADTAKQYQIPVTADGYFKGKSIIDDADASKRGMISDAAANGVSIPASDAQSPMEDIFKAEVPDSALAPAQRVKDWFTQTYNPFHPLATTDLPVDLADDIRRGLDKRINWSQAQNTVNYGTDANKSLRDGLNNSIEQAVPGVQDLNDKMHSMLSLTDQIDSALARTGKWNIGGLQAPMMGVAGMAATGSPWGALAGLGSKILEMPGTKSKLALSLNNLKNAAPFTQYAIPQGMLSSYPHTLNQANQQGGQ